MRTLLAILMFPVAATAAAASTQEIDIETATQPIIGFIFSNQGMMYKLGFDGSKTTWVAR